MSSRWEFRILGPFEVLRDGVAVPVPAAKLRTLLASLLVDANRVVSIEQLASRLWGAAPPPGARATLQNYVMRLRRTLGDNTGALIVTRPAGYLIDIDDDAVDSRRYETMVSQGRDLIDDGDPRQAATLLQQALLLWRGDALCDVSSDLLQREVVTGLTDRRLAGIEARIDAELLLGRHAETVTELRALTARYPLRERFWAQLLLALYRSGRQAEALAAYREVTSILAEDLGVDPNPELRRLHQQILHADPELACGAVPARATVPRQLPAAPRWFTGRADELRRLDEVADNASTVVISAVGGLGGIGKTSLVLHWAHHNAQRFADGQLYANLRGFDGSGEPTTAIAALRGFLDALGVDADTMPVDLDSMVGLYRSRLADRRMLIVLDDAVDTAQIAALLPGSASCVVLVTSRHRLGGLVTTHGAQPLTLDVLDDRCARELLTSRIGCHKVDDEPAAVDDLIAQCAGLPLALSIVAARAATNPDFRLATLATELAQARLDALNAGELTANLRAAFQASYAALDNATSRAFCLLGSMPGPDISLAATASLTASTAAGAAVLLRQLEAAHLVQQNAPRRYRMHDLVRLYANEQAVQWLSAQDRADAADRLADFYIHTAHAGERLLDPWRPAIALTAPVAGCVPDTPRDVTAALTWFTAEHACLLATMNGLSADHLRTWQLAWSLGTFHWRQGHLLDNVACWRSAVTATRALADPLLEMQAQRRLGLACARTGDHAEALAHLQRAARLSEDADDVVGLAHTHHTFGWVWQRHGDHEKALHHAERALELLRAKNKPEWEAGALNLVGWYHALAGRHERGDGYCRSAYDLSHRVGDREGMADALDSLGYIAHHLGRHADAVDYYERALALFEAVGHSYEQANTFDSLGETHHALGQDVAAARAWQQALRLFGAQRREADALRVQQRLADLR